MKSFIHIPRETRKGDSGDRIGGNENGGGHISQSNEKATMSHIAVYTKCASPPSIYSARRKKGDILGRNVFSSGQEKTRGTCRDSNTNRRAEDLFSTPSFCKHVF